MWLRFVSLVVWFIMLCGRLILLVSGASRTRYWYLATSISVLRLQLPLCSFSRWNRMILCIGNTLRKLQPIFHFIWCDLWQYFHVLSYNRMIFSDVSFCISIYIPMRLQQSSALIMRPNCCKTILLLTRNKRHQIQFFCFRKTVTTKHVYYNPNLTNIEYLPLRISSHDWDK